MNKYCLVTPTHTSDLTKDEMFNLKLSISYHPKALHYFCVPNNITETSLRDKFPNSKIMQLPSDYFKSIQSYNKMLLNNNFYKYFENYEYIVILQSDAILIKNIEPILSLGYDYIGAPWKRRIRVSVFNRRLHGNNKRLSWLPFHSIQVGNGGLSVRKIDAMMQITEKLKSENFREDALSGKQNEDFVIAYMCKKLHLRIPKAQLAEQFFIEQYISAKSSKVKPYGYHALQKYDIEKYYNLLNYKSEL